LFEDQTYISPGREFIPVSPDLGMKIREILSTGAEILLTEEQVKNPKTLNYEDFEVNSRSDLEIEKRKESVRIKNYLGYQTAMLSALDFFGFYTSFSELLTRGYNINDKNRDEIYLEIIDTGDEYLIDLLRLYVETNDKIKEKYRKYYRIKNILEEIEKVETIEDLDKLKDSYDF
jgi:hypothetical protein